MADYKGLLAIGDPHLASRVPGYRKDDYPRVILEKLAWCFDYARKNDLLAMVLGDVFHWPRDNANWLVVDALNVFSRLEVIGIYGNHDCVTTELEPDDSLQILVEAKRLRLVTADRPWRGTVNGRRVVVAGSPWHRPLPQRFDPIAEDGADPLVVWLTHDDLRVPGYEEAGRIDPRPIPGVTFVVNGHIHKPLGDVVKGGTTWITPGNIARVARGESHRSRTPSVLRIDVHQDHVERSLVPIPLAKPFDDVFHELPEGEIETPEEGGSTFVEGLAQLQARRTIGGEGLLEFLDKNLGRFPSEVAEDIRSLAKAVLQTEVTSG